MNNGEKSSRKNKKLMAILLNYTEENFKKFSEYVPVWNNC